MNNSNTIVVTGGAGFVGSQLINKLVDVYPEWTIISLDNYFTGSTDNHVENQRVIYVTGECQDITNIYAQLDFAPPRAVFHLGEYARIVQSFKDIDRAWEYNMRGTKEVITFCYRQKCRLVYAGSSSKFGNEGKDENLSPYAWTKAKNIEFIKNYADWFGLDYVITYFYNVYGAGHISVGQYATVLGIFEEAYRQGKPLPVVAPGTQTRDFTHITDIISGIILCFEKGSGDGYMLGTGIEREIYKVAEMFQAPIVLVPERRGERRSGRATSAKARELGWVPQMKLESYIHDFVTTQRQILSGAE